MFIIEVSPLYSGSSFSSRVASTGTSREASTLSMRTVPAGALRMGLTWRTSAYWMRARAASFCQLLLAASDPAWKTFYEAAVKVLSA